MTTLYTLTQPSFPFPALAAFAGQATLGRAREVGLALFMVARLARAARPGESFPLAVRAARATAARSWLAGLALPAASRVAFVRAVDATGADDPAALAGALRSLLAAVESGIDLAAAGELHALVAAIGEARA